MKEERFHFSDNTRVARTKWGAEYLAVIFREPDEYRLKNGSAWNVAIYRYCLPGRSAERNEMIKAKREQRLAEARELVQRSDMALTTQSVEGVLPSP